jgi:pyruvate dehydrogenase E2 component (dihydrolipoamide acetyltransferase)
MRIVFRLCLLVACGAMSGEIAFAASHSHRPNAAAAPSSSPNNDSAAKSLATPVAPAGTAPAPAAVGSKTGDAAPPIDTSITVNQGRRPAGRNIAVAKKLDAAFGTPITGQAKPPGPPVHPVGTHPTALRNAVGAAVHVSRTTATRAGGASAPAAQPAAPTAATAGTAAAAPAPAIGAAAQAPAPRVPAAAAIAAERGAAALKAATANGPSVTGTGIKRPETAPGAVGGPAKTVAAAASGASAAAVGGASFRPKHP